MCGKTAAADYVDINGGCVLERVAERLDRASAGRKTAVQKSQIKKTIYTKGKSIDGQTHYGENVLLTYSLLAK